MPRSHLLLLLTSGHASIHIIYNACVDYRCAVTPYNKPTDYQGDGLSPMLCIWMTMAQAASVVRVPIAAQKT